MRQAIGVYAPIVLHHVVRTSLPGWYLTHTQVRHYFWHQGARPICGRLVRALGETIRDPQHRCMHCEQELLRLYGMDTDHAGE